jgi:hypothetical protein
MIDNNVASIVFGILAITTCKIWQKTFMACLALAQLTIIINYNEDSILNLLTPITYYATV